MSDIAILTPPEAIRSSMLNSWTEFAHVLRKLSRTDACFHIARLMTILSRVARYDRLEAQRRALAFIGPTHQVREALAEYGASQEGKHLILTERGPLLELLRWVLACCHDASDDGMTFNDEVRRDALLESLLASNALWSLHANDGLATANERTDKSALILRLHRRQAIDNSHAPDFHHLAARSVEIMDRLMPRFMPEFPKLFEQEAGVSLKNFLLITRVFYFWFIEFAQSQPDGVAENIGVFRPAEVGAKTANPALIERYVEKFSFSLDALSASLWPEAPSPDLLEEWLLKPPPLKLSLLRDRPIVRSQDGRCIISDPFFFSELLLTGPIFRIPNASRDAAFSAYGLAFEAYVRETFDRILGTHASVARHWQDVSMQAARREVAKVDIVVTLPGVALLVEIKHSFLRDNLVAPGLEDDWRTHVRSRYGSNDKGTGQLAKAMNFLASQPSALWPAQLAGCRTFLPVLVVSDPKVGKPEAQELCSCMGQQLGLPPEARWLPYPRFGRTRHDLYAAPLAVLTVNDVEALERLDDLILPNLLLDYSRTGAGSRASFAEWLGQRNRTEKRKRWNPHLRAVALEAVKETLQLFGSEVDGVSDDLE